jgi:hypothetical protein
MNAPPPHHHHHTHTHTPPPLPAHALPACLQPLPRPPPAAQAPPSRPSLGRAPIASAPAPEVSPPPPAGRSTGYGAASPGGGYTSQYDGTPSPRVISHRGPRIKVGLDMGRVAATVVPSSGRIHYRGKVGAPRLPTPRPVPPPPLTACTRGHALPHLPLACSPIACSRRAPAPRALPCAPASVGPCAHPTHASQPSRPSRSRPAPCPAPRHAPRFTPPRPKPRPAKIRCLGARAAGRFVRISNPPHGHAPRHAP